MKEDWIGRKVRQKDQPDGPVGVVADRGKYPTWWLVEWPDGKRSLWPERSLVVVEDPRS